MSEQQIGMMWIRFPRTMTRWQEEVIRHYKPTFPVRIEWEKVLAQTDDALYCDYDYPKK